MEIAKSVCCIDIAIEHFAEHFKPIKNLSSKHLSEFACELNQLIKLIEQSKYNSDEYQSCKCSHDDAWMIHHTHGYIPNKLQSLLLYVKEFNENTSCLSNILNNLSSCCMYIRIDTRRQENLCIEELKKIYPTLSLQDIQTHINDICRKLLKIEMSLNTICEYVFTMRHSSIEHYIKTAIKETPISIDNAIRRIKNLVKHWNRHKRLATENLECPICLNEDSNLTFRWLECAHVFHAKCISVWFECNRSCPLCRTRQ